MECDRLGASEAFDRISQGKGNQREDAGRWHSIRDSAGSGGWMVTAAFAIGDEEIFGSARASDSVCERRIFRAGVGRGLLESQRRRCKNQCKWRCNFLG